jgi:capsular polysaccharide export protein
MYGVGAITGDNRESKRRFLLLQGPIGPFFRRLSRRLRQAGHGVLCVTFNAGDALFYNGSGEVLPYRGARGEWPERLREMHVRYGFTDVVLYNDCRYYHRAAVEILRPLGVATHLFEEGYFRPNRVTYEQGGVNGYSFFYPCTPEKLASVLCPESRERRYPHLPPSLRNIYLDAFAYYTAAPLGRPFYPGYRPHRDRHPLQELGSWMRRVAAYPLDCYVSGRRQSALKNGTYYLLLLQLSNDTQLRVHSDFTGGMREVIDRVAESFAAHAPKDALLVVKNHPLDSGAERLGRHTAGTAERLGLRGRVVFIDKGHLPTLVKGSRGALSVNSTSGTSVLHHGKPLFCLGRAIYDCEGLAHRGALEDFWRDPVPPDPVLFERFRRAVHAKTQIYGNYYTDKGVACILETLFRYAPFSGDPAAPDIAAPGVCLSCFAEEG